MNLSDRIIADLKKLALEYGIEKIILFGSRARGDNGDKSDVDIAVYGCRDVEFEERGLSCTII